MHTPKSANPANARGSAHSVAAKGKSETQATAMEGVVGIGTFSTASPAQFMRGMVMKKPEGLSIFCTDNGQWYGLDPAAAMNLKAGERVTFELDGTGQKAIDIVGSKPKAPAKVGAGGGGGGGGGMGPPPMPPPPPPPPLPVADAIPAHLPAADGGGGGGGGGGDGMAPVVVADAAVAAVAAHVPVPAPAPPAFDMALVQAAIGGAFTPTGNGSQQTSGDEMAHGKKMHISVLTADPHTMHVSFYEAPPAKASGSGGPIRTKKILHFIFVWNDLRKDFGVPAQIGGPGLAKNARDIPTMLADATARMAVLRGQLLARLG